MALVDVKCPFCERIDAVKKHVPQQACVPLVSSISVFAKPDE